MQGDGKLITSGPHPTIGLPEKAFNIVAGGILYINKLIPIYNTLTYTLILY